jgi:hypothetical protein
MKGVGDLKPRSSNGSAHFFELSDLIEGFAEKVYKFGLPVSQY